MSEILVGVIIGGIIGIIGQVVISILDHRNKRYVWKKDRKIKYLEKKKEKLNNLYEKCGKKLYKYDKNSNFDEIASIADDMLFVAPTYVNSAFNKFIFRMDNSEDDKFRLDAIFVDIKRSISEIEDEIKKEIDK